MMKIHSLQSIYAVPLSEPRESTRVNQLVLNCAAVCNLDLRISFCLVPACVVAYVTVCVSLRPYGSTEIRT